MSYASPAELAVYSLQASQLLPIPVPEQQAALDAASARADGYLRERYTLPIALPASADLKEAVCNIAAYTVMARRGFHPLGGDNETLRQRYEDAIKWLHDVSKGIVSPNITDSSSSGGTTQTIEGAHVVYGDRYRDAGVDFWGHGYNTGRSSRRGW